MAEIGFYHLTRTGADAALPALLVRTLARGQRAVVRAGSPARLAALDDALWLLADPPFLPHGTDDPAAQPVFLTLADTPPGDARFLFLLDGTDTGHASLYPRIFDLFDGTDPASLAAARARWSARKAEGHALVYWQQGAQGWVRKAG